MNLPVNRLKCVNRLHIDDIYLHYWVISSSAELSRTFFFFKVVVKAEGFANRRVASRGKY